MAKVVSFQRGLWEQLYVPELVRGMGVTLRHFFRNTFGSRDIVTVRYPEEKRVYPRRFRGVHRLMKRDDGTVRCVACMMCSTACPAHCIYITAGEREDETGIEKYPVTFEINKLLCVVCGMCVEACPCDALRMDTGAHMWPVEKRLDSLLDKEHLLQCGTHSLAVQGGYGPDWRERYNPVLGTERAIYDGQAQYDKKL